MDTLKQICYDWFNFCDRKDFDGFGTIPLASIRLETEGTPLEEYPPADIRDTMLEIIAEYDELNKEDQSS